MTSIKELKKEWNEKGTITTNFSACGNGSTFERVEQIMSLDGIDKIAVVGGKTSVVLAKEDAATMVRKMFYVASLLRTSMVSCFKKGKEVSLSTNTSCDFKYFSDIMAEFGCKYEER